MDSEEQDRAGDAPEEDVLVWQEGVAAAFPRFRVGLVLQRRKNTDGSDRYLVETVRSREPVWISEGVDGVSSLRTVTLFDFFIAVDYMFYFLSLTGDENTDLFSQFADGIEEYDKNLYLEWEFRQNGNSDSPPISPESPPDA